MSQKYDKLKTLLKELFQLDQPDLDFGLYRIMHAKSAEVTQFLDNDLLPQVKEAFALYKTADKAELEKDLAKAIEQAQGLGVAPDTTQKVKELRVRLASDAVDIDALESEVYDRLYTFFRRYYSEGDFLSKRVYKPGVYAIPYEGEEVKLHWANADQYYIKTSEYLRDYAFRLRPGDEKRPMRVHLRLVEAAEGEHGIAKEAQGKERRFRLADPEPLSVDDGELVIGFTYQPRPAKQKELNAAAELAVLSGSNAAFGEWIRELEKPYLRSDGTEAGTRLRVHLDRYTARNTFDYFIHKDLGGFLRRELDFYIKNEVMQLDDVENETTSRVEQYLSKVKVIRRIAGKIIDFLSQLEDFQKKLWLKKKFVVETSWCMRLGCVPDEFYAEIAANETQREEWVKLFAIDGIAADLATPGYSVPLTPEFLKGHQTLVVDSRCFNADFASRLLDSCGDLDEQTDVVLFHGENASALAAMEARYRDTIRSTYVDPPYNTGSDGFVYKDSYQHSSWIAMMDERVALNRRLLSRDGVFLASIDDIERAALEMVCDGQWGSNNRVGSIVWKGATDNNPTRIAVEHEYILCYAKSKDRLPEHWSETTSEEKQMILAGFEGIRLKAQTLDESGSAFGAFMKRNRKRFGDLYRYRRVDARGPYAARRNMENPGKPGYKYDVIHPQTGKPCTQPYWGWRFPENTMKKLLADDRIIFGEDESKIPELKVYLQEVTFPLRSVLSLDARKASNELERLFGARDVFKNPKPTELLTQLLPFTAPAGAIVLDYYAGSGTTGHAVFLVNQRDGGRRKVVLVELADYFDTVLLPRLKKVAFTPEWKDGKPARPATPEEAERSPRIMKVVRLESYEDALNNLDVRRADSQRTLLEAPVAAGANGLKEQYLLRYMLSIETRGSQSLLNVQAFQDPTAYRLRVKRPMSDERREVNVDLLETFNWLIGLAVRHVATPQSFSAAFVRDDEKRLRLNGRLKQEAGGPFWFRTVTGISRDGRKVLVIWRKLTGKPEEDNLVLEEWFTKQGYSSKDTEFDIIFVNGDNNLENLKGPDDTWKVRLIEESFYRLMFEASN